MKCIFCCVKEVDVDWDPYCGAHCALDSELVGTSCGVTMGELLNTDSLKAVHRQCWRKIQHPSHELALTHARALVSRGVHRNIEKLRVYKCSCGSYHVGHRKGV